MNLTCRIQCAVLAFAGLYVSTVTYAGQTDVSLPPLEKLKSVHFVNSDRPGQNESVSYADIFDVITACKSYARGLALLPQYHEPVLTRGPQGISLFKRVSPGVVLVMTGNFQNDKLTDMGIGSGAVIDPAGYVLTNWHVVAGYQVAVVFFKPAAGTDISRQTAFGTRVVAVNEAADLALLKIVRAPTPLTSLKLGDISNVQVAEDIHIIGHPHELFWSYSTGVISQVRDHYEWSYSDGSKHTAKVLQMQTAINPGNSGGPVFDDSGNILGLVAMSEQGQSLDYAIAVDEIREFVSRAAGGNTRGVPPREKPAALEMSFGEIGSGFKVAKLVYKDLSVYYVRDTKGVLVGVVAEQSDGTAVTATQPNDFGGFGTWIVRLPNGKRVVAHSTGSVPETIVAG